MTFDWKVVANVSSGATKIQNINQYLKSKTSAYSAPIDNYYDHRTRAITTATPQMLSGSPWISGYILASIISATELYFREIFSRTISFCPDSQKLSSEQAVNIGAVLWHGNDIFSRAAFEHISFAGTEKIKKCSREFIGYEVAKNSNTSKALEEYEKICELRHGIVHSGLVLPGKNAIKLRVTKVPHNTVIEFDAARIHEAAAACTALVESYNSELYQELVERWAGSWRSNSCWDAKKELSSLKILCAMFFSTINPPPFRPSTLVLRNQIKKEFGL